MYNIVILQTHYFISFLSIKQSKGKLILHLSFQFSIFYKFSSSPIFLSFLPDIELCLFLTETQTKLDLVLISILC